MDPREVASKPMDEAALIEELTAALDATVLWRDMDWDYTFSKSLASEYTNTLSASIIPILRRVHNEAVEKAALICERLKDDFPCLSKDSPMPNGAVVAANHLATAIRQLKEPEQ